MRKVKSYVPVQTVIPKAKTLGGHALRPLRHCLKDTPQVHRVTGRRQWDDHPESALRNLYGSLGLGRFRPRYPAPEGVGTGILIAIAAAAVVVVGVIVVVVVVLRRGRDG